MHQVSVRLRVITLSLLVLCLTLVVASSDHAYPAESAPDRILAAVGTNPSDTENLSHMTQGQPGPLFYAIGRGFEGILSVAGASAQVINQVVSPPTSVSQSPIASSTPGPTESPSTQIVTVSVPVVQTNTVRYGDSLSGIAARFGLSLNSLMRLNAIANSNFVYVGQVLKVGTTTRQQTIQVRTVVGPNEKIIPDSEAVLSPAYDGFDVDAVVRKFNGYLAHYGETVEGNWLTGSQIVDLVASRFSVGPRVLLSLLELESGWVTGHPSTSTQVDYPLGHIDSFRSGLYKQLYWAANQLNDGYYGQVYGYTSSFPFGTSLRVIIPNGLNPGSVAVQNFLQLDSTYSSWLDLVGPKGFSATYRKLFGDPFAHAIEPLVPGDLTQPALRLPFEDGHTWFLVGGPHGGYDSGSAWAAIDLAPTIGRGTCYPSPEWAVAAAPGKIVRVENGRVLENISGASFQGTGWTLMYMHMAASGRVAVGTDVQTGDDIGHPSCQGGAAQADHLHFARLYNGQWIAAAQKQDPMNIAGWIVHGGSQAYDGSMSRVDQSIDACNCNVVGLNSLQGEGTQGSALVGLPHQGKGSGTSQSISNAADLEPSTTVGSPSGPESVPAPSRTSIGLTGGDPAPVPQ